MHITQGIWLAAALVSVVVVVLLTLTAVLRQPVRVPQVVNTDWLVAAITSGTMLIFIAGKMGDLIPNTAVVDVAALAVTGVLTGIFLALGLNPTGSNGVN